MLCIFRLLIFGKTKNKHTNGGVAQLGEHLPCKQGVMGSNPIISTRYELERESTGVKEAKHTWEYGIIAQQVRARA